MFTSYARYARKWSCHTIFHGRLTKLCAENRLPLPIPLPTVQATKIQKKKKTRENDRGKTFSLELGDGRVVIASKRLLAGALQAEPFFTVHMKDKEERDKKKALLTGRLAGCL